MHPLDGPRLKIRRAESEIQTFRDAEEIFRQESDYRVVRAELNPKTLNLIYRMRISSPPPSLELGVDIGEIAHNLRSALDGLVYQLVLLNGNTPTRNTKFPIFLVGKTKVRRLGTRTLIRHFERDGRRMLNGVKPKHQAVIERLQPYKRGHGGRNSPLYWLQEVNNADKHRLIQVVGTKMGLGPVILREGTHTGGYPFEKIQPGMILKDGAIFGEAPLACT